jgi:antitoxin ParD1/3/4
MATMNISLPDPMKAWVEQQAGSGRYSNSSDYVRDLIRRDQEQAAALAELQHLITVGIESGGYAPFDRDGFLADMKRDHA